MIKDNKDRQIGHLGLRPQTRQGINEMIMIIFAQKKIIILTFLIISLGSVLAAYYLPPQYDASATISIKARQNKTIKTTITSETLALEAETIKSSELISKVIKNLQSQSDTHKDGKDSLRYASKSFLWDLPRSLNAQIDYIRDRLKTSINPLSSEIEIRYYERDRPAVLDLLNALIEQYISDRNIEPIGVKQRSLLHPQLPLLNEDELSNFIKSTNGVSQLAEIEKNLNAKSNLEQQLYSLSNETIEKTLYIEQFERAFLGNNWQYFASISTNAAIVDLTRSLRGLFIERGTILRQYQEDSFNVKAIDKQIESVQKELKEQLQAFITSLKNELNVIAKKQENINSIIIQIADRNLALKRQMILADKSDIESSQSTSKSVMPFSLSAKNETGFIITIVKAAHASEKPVSTKKDVIIPIGLVLGLISGLSLGFIREYFDHTIKNPADVERYLGMQMLFSLLEVRHTAKENYSATTKPMIIIVLIPILLISLYAAKSLYSSTSGRGVMPSAPEMDNILLPAEASLENTKSEIISEKSSEGSETLQRSEIPQSSETTLTTVDKFKAIYRYYDPESGINSMQLYAFSNLYSAKMISDRLRTLGINTYVKTVSNETGRGTLHKVLIAPFCYDKSMGEDLRIKKEGFIGSINNVSILVNQSTGEISLRPEDIKNNKDATLITQRLSSMGWMSKIYGDTENGETLYRVVILKDCN
jgi:uncharacterized protein involved in exopolysaccharide biosynthesis